MTQKTIISRLKMFLSGTEVVTHLRDGTKSYEHLETFTDGRYVISMDKVGTKKSAGFIELRLMVSPDSQSFALPIMSSDQIRIRKVLFPEPSKVFVHVFDRTSQRPSG